MDDVLSAPLQRARDTAIHTGLGISMGISSQDFGEIQDSVVGTLQSRLVDSAVPLDKELGRTSSTALSLFSLIPMSWARGGYCILYIGLYGIQPAQVTSIVQ